MKKYIIFGIILLIIIFLLSINFLFHVLYFSNLHKNLKPISETDKQKALEILNKSINLNEYQIKIGNVYAPKNKDFVKIELIKNNTKKYYIIDLKKERIVKG